MNTKPRYIRKRNHSKKEKDMQNDDKTSAWAMATLEYFSAHPQEWPIERETPVEGTPYMACLRIRQAKIRGADLWLFDVAIYKARDAQIEMYMNMMSSENEEELLAFIRGELGRGCATPLSYIDSLYRKMQEKGDDDPHGDFDFDFD